MQTVKRSQLITAAKALRNEVIRFGSFDIRLELRKGDTRSGVDAKGVAWSRPMHAHYGEFLSSIGVDGDPLDVYVGENSTARSVYIVHQAQKDNWHAYDEDKVMLGFDSEAQAVETYLKHYNNDQRFMLAVTEMPLSKFKSALRYRVPTSGTLVPESQFLGNSTR